MENQPHEITPWHDIEARYQPGQQVQGTVTRVTHFGVFVQVEPGLEGIIYTFELGPGPAAVAGFVPGQQVQLYVRSIDAGRKRMELCLEQLLTPGLLEEQTIPAALRRSKPASEQPSWPTPLPDIFSQLPLTPPKTRSVRGAFVDHAPHTSQQPLAPLQAPIDCPHCQRTIQAAWQYCVYCGNALRRLCPACGNAQPNLPDARYCHECGNTLL
ncbi:MAG: double zinc ribbon domain-containing protein [Ktedonobacteraceae bacterium]